MKMIMANHPRLIEALRNDLSTHTKLIDIESVRSYVSSPRLMDLRVRDFSAENLTVVGDTFLDRRTMLADAPQQTYGVSLSDWDRLQSTIVVLEEDYSHNDTSIANLQIWPFDPGLLDEQQARLAVALSYTNKELYAEPRIVGALNEILEEMGFFVDAERY